MKKFIELNHPIEDGMPAYPGFPPPKIDVLPRTGFRFYAVPLRIVRGASFPVRAIAEMD